MSKITKMWIRLIELGVQMHRGTLLHPTTLPMLKNRTKNPTRRCLVCTLIRELVLLARLMIPKVSTTSISVQHALLWGARHTPTQKLNVEIKVEKIQQKTIRSGHGSSGTCPDLK